MLARCQFGGMEGGKLGATLTYPIKGMPWRRNIMKHFEFAVCPKTVALLFSEVFRLRREHSKECLGEHSLWSDFSEKANAITRDRRSNTLCYSIAVWRDGAIFDEQVDEQYSMREDSEALLSSDLYKIISHLIRPHEIL